MEALFTAIGSHPEWVAFLAAAGACVFTTSQWVKTVGKLHDLAVKFAAGQESSNQRLERIEGRLERALEK